MSRRFHRLQLLLAVLAWLAQLWLPVAHAAMARGADGTGSWCGSSPAYAAQLAQLPAEIRLLLDQQAPHNPSAQDCTHCGVPSTAAALPPVAFTLILRAAGLETLPAAVIPAQRASLGAPPPARGPPQSS